MKFCYIDESGTGCEPFAVMVGIIVDAYRMRPTKSDWNSVLAELSALTGRTITEFHTRDFYPGKGVWHGIEGEMRADILTILFDWIVDRKHDLVYVAVDRELFTAGFEQHKYSDTVQSLWRFMALHLTLAIQRNFRNEKKNKGNTVLVFDNEEWEKKDFTDLIINPPDWTDTYYYRDHKNERLDQIVDVPHFVDSKHVGLIQVADLVAFFLRRHLEILSGKVKVRYPGEDVKVEAWISKALGLSIPSSMTYLQKGRCEASDYFCSFKPEILP